MQLKLSAMLEIGSIALRSAADASCDMSQTHFVRPAVLQAPLHWSLQTGAGVQFWLSVGTACPRLPTLPAAAELKALQQAGRKVHMAC